MTHIFYIGSLPFFLRYSLCNFFARYLVWGWWIFSFSTLMMLFHLILPVAISKLAISLNTLTFRLSVFFHLAVLLFLLFVCVFHCHYGVIGYEFFFNLFLLGKHWPSWICCGDFQCLWKFLSLLLKLFLLYFFFFPFMQLQWNINWTWSLYFKSVVYIHIFVFVWWPLDCFKKNLYKLEFTISVLKYSNL